MPACVLSFLKQKTAYEMRISDWSSDVCSSDLLARRDAQPRLDQVQVIHIVDLDAEPVCTHALDPSAAAAATGVLGDHQDRTRVVQGTRGSVRVDLGGRRLITKKTKTRQTRSMRHHISPTYSPRNQ